MWSSLDNDAGNVSGGFLNDSRSSNDERRGNLKRVENIVPVMIQHLLRSSDGVQIWGTEVRIITFIGIIRQMERTTTKATYEIEDETGTIKGFRWLEVGKMLKDPIVELNTYVRVYGHLREQNEQKHVLILKIFPMTNLNELTNHLLEVAYVLLRSQKMHNDQNQSIDMLNTIDMSEDSHLSGLTKEQTIVFKIIQMENNTVNGIEKDILKSRVPKSILPHVENIVDFLISEGHIYTTLTDDHYKTT